MRGPQHGSSEQHGNWPRRCLHSGRQGSNGPQPQPDMLQHRPGPSPTKEKMTQQAERGHHAPRPGDDHGKCHTPIAAGPPPNGNQHDRRKDQPLQQNPYRRAKEHGEFDDQPPGPSTDHEPILNILTAPPTTTTPIRLPITQSGQGWPSQATSRPATMTPTLARASLAVKM